MGSWFGLVECVLWIRFPLCRPCSKGRFLQLRKNIPAFNPGCSLWKVPSNIQAAVALNSWFTLHSSRIIWDEALCCKQHTKIKKTLPSIMINYSLLQSRGATSKVARSQDPVCVRQCTLCWVWARCCLPTLGIFKKCAQRRWCYRIHNGTAYLQRTNLEKYQFNSN